MSKNKSTFFFSAWRIAVDSLLTAMFFALSMLSIKTGPINFTVASLPAVLAALLYGPADGFLVAFIGSFLEQMLNYGLTPTTILWMLAPSARGLVVGFLVNAVHKLHPEEAIFTKKRLPLLFVFTICASLVVSCLNTAVMYIDSKMYHYYTFAYVFGSFLWRILSGIITAILVCLVIIPIVKALQRAKLTKRRVF